MESVNSSADPITKPIILFDSDSIEFGSGSINTTQLAKKVIGSNIYCIIEACEPSVGIRFCRTYFLQRGKSHSLLSEVDSLLNNESEAYHEEIIPVKPLETIADTVPPDVTASVRRAESIYIKLWLTLRYIVKLTFASHSDVLEAGTFIQVINMISYIDIESIIRLLGKDVSNNEW